MLSLVADRFAYATTAAEVATNVAVDGVSVYLRSDIASLIHESRR